MHCQKSNKHFSSDNDSKDNDSKSSHSTSSDNTKVVSGDPDKEPPDGPDDDAFSTMSINSDTPNQQNKPQTTKVMKSLLKIASSIGLEIFFMEGGFQQRRRRLNNFEKDLRVIFGMEDETLTFLENYPKIEKPRKARVDKAIATFCYRNLKVTHVPSLYHLWVVDQIC